MRPCEKWFAGMLCTLTLAVPSARLDACTRIRINGK
ncbi:MAG: hypothetical protein BWY31_02079 [Lentisphaerae bacterium ADurb.Bin242]|nr:MAG: hypothetical protein BWY31_02079 [Lentisphaerae bacterium ADurb.Bin242]